MKTKLLLLIMLLLVGCSEWIFAPTILATYVLENRDNKPVIIRLFTADGGLVAQYQLDPGMIIQDQKEIQSIETYRRQRYKDYHVQVVWAVSTADGATASVSMDLWHGRTARIIWTGKKIQTNRKTVPQPPNVPNENDAVYIYTDSKSSTIPHDELVEIINRTDR